MKIHRAMVRILTQVCSLGALCTLLMSCQNPNQTSGTILVKASHTAKRSSPADRPADSHYAGLSVEIPAGTQVPLSYIIVKARAYLSKEFKDFDQEAPPIPEVQIYFNNSKESIHVRYDTYIGKPFWSVTFDRAGNIVSRERGILADEFEPLTPLAPR